MRILLCCGAGASTSLVVEAMKNALAEDEKDFKIVADTYQNFSNLYKDYDVVLLGPHVRYAKASLEKECSGAVPIGVIDGTDYAMQNGKNVLELAKKMYNEFKK